VFRAQADWTLTHTSHKDTEQSTIEASVTLDGVTLTGRSGDHRMNDLQFADKIFWTPNTPAKWTLYITCTSCWQIWMKVVASMDSFLNNSVLPNTTEVSWTVMFLLHRDWRAEEQGEATGLFFSTCLCNCAIKANKCYRQCFSHWNGHECPCMPPECFFVYSEATWQWLIEKHNEDGNLHASRQPGRFTVVNKPPVNFWIHGNSPKLTQHF
jgi:hypothetical protein